MFDKMNSTTGTPRQYQLLLSINIYQLFEINIVIVGAVSWHSKKKKILFDSEITSNVTAPTF